MATTNLRPFRDYDEHDVTNLYGYRGATLDKGVIVRINGSGWQTSTSDIQLLQNIGAGFANTVSQRYGVSAQVTTCGTGQLPLGITLAEVAETDENGESLKFNPRKREEMGVVLSGQAIPIATRGFFLYSGVINGNTSAAGVAVYPSGAGLLTTTNTNQTWETIVGQLIGAPDGNNWSLVYVNIQ